MLIWCQRDHCSDTICTCWNASKHNYHNNNTKRSYAILDFFIVLSKKDLSLKKRIYTNLSNTDIPLKLIDECPSIANKSCSIAKALPNPFCCLYIVSFYALIQGLSGCGKTAVCAYHCPCRPDKTHSRSRWLAGLIKYFVKHTYIYLKQRNKCMIISGHKHVLKDSTNLAKSARCSVWRFVTRGQPMQWIHLIVFDETCEQTLLNG